MHNTTNKGSPFARVTRSMQKQAVYLLPKNVL